MMNDVNNNLSRPVIIVGIITEVASGHLKYPVASIHGQRGEGNSNSLSLTIFYLQYLTSKTLR